LGGDGDGVGEELREDVGEPVGEPDTTNRPPDLTAPAGGTEGCRDVTGRV
jgi:hypothetical protein